MACIWKFFARNHSRGHRVVIDSKPVVNREFSGYPFDRGRPDNYERMTEFLAGSSSVPAPVEGTVKLDEITKEVDERLDLLSLPCDLTSNNLSLTLEQIGDWSTKLSTNDHVIYCQRVVPILVRYLRFTYTTHTRDTDPSMVNDPDSLYIGGGVFNWVQTIWMSALGGNDFTNDRRFITLQVLHKCMTSQLPAGWDGMRQSEDYVVLVFSTFYQLLLRSSQISLEQTIVDDIAVDWANFQASLESIRGRGSLKSYISSDVWRSAKNWVPLWTLVDSFVSLSPEAKSAVKEALEAIPLF